MTLSLVSRVLTISLFLGAAACGGDSDSDYQAACEKLVECGVNEGESASECVTELESDIENGNATQEQVDACIDCITDATCETLVSDCAAVCSGDSE